MTRKLGEKIGRKRLGGKNWEEAEEEKMGVEKGEKKSGRRNVEGKKERKKFWEKIGRRKVGVQKLQKESDKTKGGGENWEDTRGRKERGGPGVRRREKERMGIVKGY